MKLNVNNSRIAIIGLGYVGLPLAVEFGKRYETIGFDIKTDRINELLQGHDHTLEVNDQELAGSTLLSFSGTLKDIADCNIYIVTVPTPIDKHKQPDLGPLRQASKEIASLITKGDIVIYESTVYPGATEDECIPIIERGSGLGFNIDFFAGYSPERINPGDKKHRLRSIKKVTSGSTPEAAEFVDQLYKSIIEAGTHKAPSIKTAEASKVIENTQRDLNIALINELAIIFNKLDIDTQAVLEAAGTKWNFLPFRPGLVGGHCIGVDPYYLTHKAQAVGYQPDIILAGRRINDNMARYVAGQMIKSMISHGLNIRDSRVLIMGLTFKENCPDLRNTKIVDLVRELAEFNVTVDTYDPWVDVAESQSEYGITPIKHPMPNTYDGVILAVAHEQFEEMSASDFRNLCKPNSVLYDLKYLLNINESDLRL
jgi:UDP-N-acetyl-D-glucosamine/UDP-N-acetyl-D-galactosamine dehydrogenase